MLQMIRNIKHVYDEYSVDKFFKGWDFAVRYANNKPIKVISAIGYPFFWTYGICRYIYTHNRNK